MQSHGGEFSDSVTHFVELEIGLQRMGDDIRVELRFDRSDSEADVAPIAGQAAIDLEALRAASSDRKIYGQLLGQSLFADARVRAGFEKGCVMAESLGMPLRVRLSIDHNSTELHGLAWEALGDPATGALLATREQLLFSRFISSEDWRPVHLRPRDEMRALVAIANPTNVSSYSPGGRPLSPVDVPGETQRATAGLQNIPVTALATPGSATLSNIVGKLREGYDIFYLVCHGALIDGKPLLYLENEAGEVTVVAGTDFATQLSELKQRPRLVVLASCQSAGTGAEARSADEGVLAALGPRLAEAGIPAVIAMQGNVTMQTVAAFMPVFFQELQRDGQIDRAMAAARGAVRDHGDWWIPVLFMCLKKGQIWWYTPRFTDETGEFNRWLSLVNNIKRGRCTPILGSGLLESLVGSFRDIARQWARTYRYPMAGDECEELPLVAQYLKVDQGEETFVREKFCEALREGVLRQYREIPADVAKGPVEQLISAAGAIRREQEVAEPHAILARLGLPLFLSTNPDNLLADALTAAGKKPVVALCPRDDGAEGADDDARDFQPTSDAPLVYHLFGHLADLDSVILTQDDYFDYLIDVTRNNDIIPTTVRAQLANTALLFLGFQLSDWDFRVFFRSIMSQEGRKKRRDYSHVAVQIDPEQDRLVDPDRARRYLERYFYDTKISIFWGRAEDFLKELLRQMEK